MKKTKKITIRGNTKIIETEEESYVEKKKNKDLSSLFEYLHTRGLNITPEIINEDDKNIRYKYYKENKYIENNKDEELIKKVSEMHYKTTYYKNVSRKKYKDIYNTLIDNVDYLKDYYNNIIMEIEKLSYPSPSEYLLSRNYSVINSNLAYIERELNTWYNLVKEKTKERVSIVHNNLKLKNAIKDDDLILTSWDNYLVDTPVLDIYKLYKNEYKNSDFIHLLEIYNENFELTKEEKKLLKILISMPQKIEERNTEYEKVVEIKSLLDYIYRTNNLVKSAVLN